METATTARPDFATIVAERLSESLDRLCVLGMAYGLAAWLVLGLGLEWAGDHFKRPALGYLGVIFLYLGAAFCILLLLRWLAYMISPRTAMLLDREVGAYFLSPIAYLVLIGLLAIDTINFWEVVTRLAAVRSESAGEMSAVVRFVAYNLWFWLGMLFVIPIITMRLLAEEKRSGTIEVLMTAPVTEFQVVMSKFLAALLFYGVVISPSVLYLLVLKLGGKYEFEMLPVAASYIGTFTLGAMFVSIGVFFSSLTRNQIIAAMLTFAVLILFFATWMIELDRISAKFGPNWAEAVKYVTVLQHIGELGTGRMDVKFLLLHLSVTVFMLFVTVKVLEARKWK